jgi:hypothetical protein
VVPGVCAAAKQAQSSRSVAILRSCIIVPLECYEVAYSLRSDGSRGGCLKESIGRSGDREIGGTARDRKTRTLPLMTLMTLIGGS